MLLSRSVLVIICVIGLSIACREKVVDVEKLPVENLLVRKEIVEYGKTILERYATPPNFERTELSEKEYGTYLRSLPLKPHGSLVTYYNGSFKSNYDVYEAVIDLEIGDKDLHQCADAVIRLRAEYLWKNGRYDDIHFNFTNGFKVDYSEWMKGRKMIVDGNQTSWDNGNVSSNTYDDFWDYLELIFMYAGTASLEKELNKIDIAKAQIGDVLIQGGHPGHAVIIVDEAIDINTGKKVYLLAQSYMPAQELQLLRNPKDAILSPWYDLEVDVIATPEWTFSKEDLRRF